MLSEHHNTYFNTVTKDDVFDKEKFGKFVRKIKPNYSLIKAPLKYATQLKSKKKISINYAH